MKRSRSYRSATSEMRARLSGDGEAVRRSEQEDRTSRGTWQRTMAQHITDVEFNVWKVMTPQVDGRIRKGFAHPTVFGRRNGRPARWQPACMKMCPARADCLSLLSERSDSQFLSGEKSDKRWQGGPRLTPERCRGRVRATTTPRSVDTGRSCAQEPKTFHALPSTDSDRFFMRRGSFFFLILVSYCQNITFTRLRGSCGVVEMPPTAAEEVE
jgi:hypothetical protein